MSVTTAPVASPATARLSTTLPARMLGWGMFVPERVVTNHDLEQTLDTSDEWIVERSGIRERHRVGPDDTTASMAIAAGRAALDRARVPASRVDLLVLATTTADQVTPATAATVQHALGTRGAAFDLNAACSGFVHAFHVAAACLRTPGIDHVLVIGADRFASFADPADRTTAVLFGDGAGALLLGAGSEDPAGPGLLGVDLGGDGSAVSSLEVPPGQPYLTMDGREVFRRATRGIVESCAAALERAGATAADVDVFVPHQANLRIIEAAANRIGVPMDRVVVDIDRYGNTSSASVPIAISEAARDGRIAPGSIVLACGIGAGMSWASTLFRWGA
jgi:3-oxoacyl-[acyl-carrier-protein] synthase-3